MLTRETFQIRIGGHSNEDIVDIYANKEEDMTTGSHHSKFQSIEHVLLTEYVLLMVVTDPC